MRKKITLLITSVALLLGSSNVWAQQGVLLPEYQNEGVTPRRGDANSLNSVGYISTPGNVNNEFGAGETADIQNGRVIVPGSNHGLNTNINTILLGSTRSQNIVIRSYNALGRIYGSYNANAVNSSNTVFGSGYVDKSGQHFGAWANGVLLSLSTQDQTGKLTSTQAPAGWFDDYGPLGEQGNQFHIIFYHHGATGQGTNGLPAGENWANGWNWYTKVAFNIIGTHNVLYTTTRESNMTDNGVALEQINGSSEMENSSSNIGVPKVSGGAAPNKLDDYIRPTTIAVSSNGSNVNTFNEITFNNINWWYETYVPRLDTAITAASHYWECGHGSPNLRRIDLYRVDPAWQLTSTPRGLTFIDAAIQLINGARVCVNTNVLDQTGNIADKASTDGTYLKTNALIVWPVADRVTFRTAGNFRVNMAHEPDSATNNNVKYSAAQFPDPDADIYLYKGASSENIGVALKSFSNPKYTTVTTNRPYTSTISSVFGVNGNYMYTGNMAKIHTDSTTFANGNMGVIEVGTTTAGKKYFHVYGNGMLKNFVGCTTLANFPMYFGHTKGGTPQFKINSNDTLYIVNFGNNGTNHCDADLLFHTTSVDSIKYAFTGNGAGALQIQALSDVRLRGDGAWNAATKGNNMYALSDGGNISTQKLSILSDNIGGVGHGLVTFWAETDSKTDACAGNTATNRFSKSGNIYFNDAVTLTRAAAATTQTNIIAANNIRTASLTSNNANDEDTTNIVSRMGDIYLGYSAGSKVYNASDVEVSNGLTAQNNIFTYNGTSASGTLNILAGFDDQNNTARHGGGNIYFTQINANMTAAKDHATNIEIPFSNEYTCNANNDSVLHRRAGSSMQHYEHAGIIGGVGRGGIEGDFATYAQQLENAGTVADLNMTAKSLDYKANDGDLTVDAGTRGNIIMNTGSSLDFQGNAGNGFFRTRYGDIDMRGETDATGLNGALLFLASSDETNKWTTSVCGCKEQRNNVYLQDFQYTNAATTNGSVFVGADNNIKLNYGGLTNRATQADPFLSKEYDGRYNWGTPYKGDYHCDLNQTVNKARPLTLNFTGVNGGFAAVAADRIDVYKKMIYTGGAGVGMSKVPGQNTLQGESVSGYGLYMKTTAAKNSWTFNSLEGEVAKCPFSCTADDCGDAALHNIVRMTFHDDARIIANNQKVLLASPVIESYGHLELDVMNNIGSNTSITVRTDSLIMHDSLILNETATNKVRFETWSSGLKNPVMKFGYKRTSPPVQEIIYDKNGSPIKCNDCVTHTKGDPNSKIDTMVIMFKNDASIERTETMLVDHTVITFLTDSFDHTKLGTIRNAQFYTDLFKVRNQVEFWENKEHTKDGHFELVSEDQMHSKDYAGVYARHLHMEPIGACGRPYSDLWLCDPALDVITTSTFGGYGKLHADVHVEIEAKLAPGYASLGLLGNCYEQKAGTLSMEDLRLDKGAEIHYSIGNVAGFNGEYADCIEADEITLYGDVNIFVEIRACQSYSPGCYPIIRYNSVAIDPVNLNNLKLGTKTLDGNLLSLDTSEPGIVYLCVGDVGAPVIRREVHIPTVAGVITDPEPGSHYITSYKDFTFTASFATEKPLKVTTNRMVDGVVEELIGKKNANGEYVYTVKTVKEYVALTFGPDFATANELIDGTAVWSYNNMIHIKVAKKDIASIYSVAGQLIRRIELPEGDTATVPMERGVYIVTLKDGSVHKVVLK